MRNVWPRRNFLELASIVFPSYLLGLEPRLFGLAPQEQRNSSSSAPVADLFPTQPPELAREMVTVSHYDLYRIEKPSEMEELALDEALSDGAALIEWPERAGTLSAETLHVHLEIVGESARRIEISGPARWAEFLASGADVERN